MQSKDVWFLVTMSLLILMVLGIFRFDDARWISLTTGKPYNGTLVPQVITETMTTTVGDPILQKELQDMRQLINIFVLLFVAVLVFVVALLFALMTEMNKSDCRKMEIRVLSETIDKLRLEQQMLPTTKTVDEKRQDEKPEKSQKVENVDLEKSLDELGRIVERKEKENK